MADTTAMPAQSPVARIARARAASIPPMATTGTGESRASFVQPSMPPRVGRRHVGLPDMRAFSINFKCEVDAIVDDERNSHRAQERVQGCGFCQKGGVMRARAAVLHDGNATVNGLLHGRQQAVDTFARFIRYEVKMERELLRTPHANSGVE